MKSKLISDTTLKISISLNDLEERGMELSDFLMPQEKTEDFFYAILEEIDMPDHFKMSGMLSFRVTPKSDKVDIFVTKSEFDGQMGLPDLSSLGDLDGLTPEEILKKMADGMRAMGDQEALDHLEEEELLDELKEAAAELSSEGEEELSEEYPDYIHYVLRFDQFKDMINFAKNVDFPVEAAEIYKYKTSYQMTVLLYVENQPRSYADTIYARMLEHAQPSKRSRAYLREHALLMQEGDILQKLAEV